MRTVPVKYSAGPFAEGCEPLLVISILSPSFFKKTVFPFSETSHSLQLFGISRAVDRAHRGSVVDFPKIVRCTLDLGSSDAVLKAAKLRGTGEGHDPWLLAHQPGR